MIQQMSLLKLETTSTFVSPPAMKTRFHLRYVSDGLEDGRLKYTEEASTVKTSHPATLSSHPAACFDTLAEAR